MTNRIILCYFGATIKTKESHEETNDIRTNTMGNFSPWRDLLHHENFNGNIVDVKRLALIALNIILSGFWLISCVQRDKSRDMEMYWRQRFIESKALLGISIRQTDMVIMLNNYDTHTWDMYCQQKEAFKINLAKKLYAKK